MSRTLIALLLLVSSPALAYTPEYAPWLPGKGPKSIPMTAVKQETTLDASVVFFRGAQTKSRMLAIARQDEEGAGVTVAVTTADGETLVGPDDVEAGFMFPEEAFAGDINGDSIDDFVAFIPSGGSGIGSVLSQAVVALSGGGTYSITVFPTFFGASNDIVRVGDRAAVIQTLLIFGEPGADGKEHNYWVHMLYPISGSRIEMRKQPEGWPKWVQYTAKENHKEATGLSSEQKQRLLAEAGFE